MRRLLLALLVVMISACGGPDTRDEPETVIGTPPSPKDDPFFFVAMPAEAIPAAPTGTIGPNQEGQEGQEGQDVQDRREQSSVAPDPARRGEGTRCFACVRICPETVSDAECDEGYDTICGWGRSADRSVAAEIATGECNAALDLARSGSRYSSISGACPAASCQ